MVGIYLKNLKTEPSSFNVEPKLASLYTLLPETLISLAIYAACWKGGQPAPFLHLARTFDLVEEEKGKIKATLMLCNMFRRFLFSGRLSFSCFVFFLEKNY